MTRNWLTISKLAEEFKAWPESDRNEGDLRFGQYISITYDGIPSEVFSMESRYYALGFLSSHLADVQR